jgi:creatinine amidohydrolase
MGYSIFDETMVDMAWPEVERAVQEGAIVLLPTGVIEEHGPHMSLGVDTYCSYLICKLVKHELETKGIKTLVTPPYYWGINNATGAFPGSFTVRKKTMKALIYDILASMRRWGITYVFNINWHGDHEHNVAILESIQEARIDTGIRAYCLLKKENAKRFGLSGNEAHVIIWEPNRSPDKVSSRYLEIHADAFETSIMMHYFPKEVDIGMAKTLKSTDLTIDQLMIWRKGWIDAKKITPLGYFGHPASFSPYTGKKFMEDDARDLSTLIDTFLKGNYRPPDLRG